MTSRLRWAAVLLALLSALTWAEEKKDKPKEQPKKEQPKKEEPKKEPPKLEGGNKLQGTNLWYLLSVPEKYDPKETYPLLVLAESAPDQAKQTLEAWQKHVQSDRIFLACLQFPKDSKEDQEKRITEMVIEVCKKYEPIDRKNPLLLGVEGGANSVLKFAATYPHVFVAAIALAPNAFPEFAKIKPGGPRLIGSATDVLITVNPSDKDRVKKVEDARKDFMKRGMRAFIPKAAAGGGGKAGDDELKYALKMLRSHYPAAKRSQLADAWREEEKAHQAKEAEKGKEKEKEKPKENEKVAHKQPGPAVKPEPGEKPEPAEKPGPAKKTASKTEETNPDDLLLKARELDQKKDYAAAVAAYEQLAKLRPDSDYSRVALDRIKELKADPSVAKAIADGAAGPECKSWLVRARNYLRAKMPDKAVAEFNKVVAKYPDTSYAEEARKELARLQGTP